MLLTPYEQWLAKKGVAFFQARGFEVVGEEHLGITDSFEKMVEMTPEQIVKWAQSRVSSNADGAFISCTDFPTMGAAERLEGMLGIPVITANQATVWQLLKLARYNCPLVGYGKLLHKF